MLDADGFRGGDLHVIDVAAIPHRLEHAVAEPEHQHVLHCFLAEVVIDAIHLLLVEVLVREPVQRARAVEVDAEWLLDDDPAPSAQRRL